jgi:hypothetical protein
MADKQGISTAKGFHSTNMERIDLYDGKITYNASYIPAPLEVGRTYIFSVFLDTLSYAHTFVLTVADNTISKSTASKFNIVNGSSLVEGFIYLSYNRDLKTIDIMADAPVADTKANIKISYVILC